MVEREARPWRSWRLRTPTGGVAALGGVAHLPHRTPGADATLMPWATHNVSVKGAATEYIQDNFGE
jgi:hypothetical protein